MRPKTRIHKCIHNLKGFILEENGKYSEFININSSDPLSESVTLQFTKVQYRERDDELRRQIGWYINGHGRCR